jgi:hypothetical protein
MLMRFTKETVRFAQAAILLHTIKNDQDRLDLVLELQRFIIRNISKSEKRIRRLRRAWKRLQSFKSANRLTKEKSKLVKHLQTRINQRVSNTQQLIFLWKCFGDGIAYIYQSKYSLKHLFFDGDYNVKRPPGFLSGKKGFRKEFKICRMGINMGVPVVMSDITNVIRHGDVCALAGPDPVPVEVKSSQWINSRGKRQIDELQVLAKFYANDGAENFRGALNTKRVALKYSEITYEKEINNCMHEASACGVFSISPEDGLRYIAYTTKYFTEDTDRLYKYIKQYTNTKTLAVTLTPEESWLPTFPFTLSMEPANAIQFMQEKIGIVILIDLGILKEHFKAQNIHATMLMDGLHALQICIDPNDLMMGAFRISELLFLRIACEFQSLKWFANEHSATLKFPEEFQPVNIDSPFILLAPPPGWQEAKDCFATENPKTPLIPSPK